ncbi:MAG: recombinase family protein, partial [Solirubrobacterales bacterium]
MASLPFSGYVRISQISGRSGDSFISPDVQVETIERLAAVHKIEVSEIVQELDVSGGRPIDDRDLGRLVREVEEGKSGGILIWKLSRFSRSLLDGVTVADIVTRAGGRLLAGDYDSASPMGKAILGFLLGYAEEERDARREGWKEAQSRAVARGVHPTKCPIGYQRTEAGTLIPDPDTSGLVLKAFQARAKGASLQDTADVLGMSRSGVKTLLQSVTYLGHVRMGDLLNEGAHEPLVPLVTWQLAQRRGAAPAHDGSLADKGVLAGLIVCENCEFVLSVTGRGTGKSHQASYSCRGRRVGKHCTARASASIARVDEYIWPMLQERAGEVDLEAALVEFYESQVAMSEADRELRAFLEGAKITDLGPDLYAAEVSRRRESLRVATEGFRQALDSQNSLAETDGIQGRRELARRLLESVTLSKSKRGKWEPVESRL